jgi:hypothetical protein
MSKKLYFLFLLFFSSLLAQSPEDAESTETDFTNVDLNNLDSILNHTSDEKNEVVRLYNEFLTDLVQVELLGVFIFTISTIVHEYGHVVAGNTLFDTLGPAQIHLGEKNRKEKIPELFSFWNIHFHKELPWKKGRAEWRKISFKKSRAAYKKIDDTILCAAGGLSSATFMYILLATITGYCMYRDNCENKGSFNIVLKSFFSAFNPFSHILDTKNVSTEQKRFLLNATFIICLILIYNIFYGCTPYRGGDGLAIWKDNLAVTGTPLKVVHVLSTLGAWSCWTLLIKKYCNARKKLFPEISKISIPIVLASLLLIYFRLIPEAVV